MKPGRGNMAKTGVGLPPTLMCGSPIKQEFDLTARYEAGKKKLQNQIGQAGTAEAFKSAGIIIDPKTNVAKAAPYPKKFVGGEKESNSKVPTGPRTNAFIQDGNGRATVTANREQGRSNEELYKQFKADSTNTMNMRNRNANLYNLSGGGKAPEKWNAEDLKTMRGLGKATR